MAPTKQQEPIAIVGSACRFPGGEFSPNLRNSIKLMLTMQAQTRHLICGNSLRAHGM